ncbi:MAG: DMT family transporter [Halanaerobiales bacterium]|nr:DMT family transporter [Halanaerobiales bacterium]
MQLRFNKFVLMAIFSCLIFGLEFVFVAQALEKIQPMHLLGFRFILSVLTLTIFKFLGLIKVNFQKKGLRSLFILSLLQPVIYFILETIGIGKTSATEAGIIIATIPVMVTILTLLFLKESTSLFQIFSSLLSIGGVILITVMAGSSGESSSLFGISLLFLAVFTYAIYMILVRKVSSIFTPVEITYVMMWAGAIVFNVISIAQHFYKGSLNEYFIPLGFSNVLISIFYLGVVSTLGFFLGNYIIANLGASRSAIFANLTTIIAILAGIMIRHDQFYWYHAVGTIMILLGVFGSVNQNKLE